MPDFTDDAIANRLYITLILRLALDERGRLILGELVDTTDAPPQRFRGVVGLNQVVQNWLVQHARPEDD
ncbi:MAG TPA: hypothetical protein VFZ66_06355 [Herpetosiphonaceae bacterium]